MYCMECGNEITESVKFCAQCGSNTKIEAAPSQTAQAQSVINKSKSLSNSHKMLAIALIAFAAFAFVDAVKTSPKSTKTDESSTPRKYSSFDPSKAQAVTATEAADEFKSNKLAAKTKYSNPTVVSGTIDKIEEAPYDKQRRIRLSFNHDSNPFTHLSATLIDANDQRALAIKLSRGDFVRVGCTGVDEGTLAPEFKDCALVEAPGIGNAASAVAEKVDSISLVLDLRGSKTTVPKYVGKLVQVEIFVEKYETNSGVKRLIDANSGFFCDIDPTYASSFPSHRGSYVVKGIFVVSGDKVGISRCQFISK